jgi:hypothetical protein
MSSTRYQSKLLNFISQQSQRWTEQWETGLRHFQVAAKWSVETLLYSISQLLQPDEWSEKRLQSQTTTTTDQPQIAPATDAGIQEVLEVVQNLPSEAAQADLTINPFAWLESLWFKFVHKESKPLPPESKLQYHIPEVRAIATQLSNRSLVLVTTDNRILDVLTSQQQAKVATRITKVLAEYRHFYRLAEIEQEKKLLPEINQILDKLTGNNFPDTSLPESQITFKSNSLINPNPLFTFIDTVLAKVETSTIIPVQQRSQEIINYAQSQLNIFLYGKEQSTTRGEIKVNSEQLENQQPNISELIEAAINYFFGLKSGKIELPENYTNKLQPGQSTNKVLPKSANLPSSNFTPDVWLTWDDLFGNEKNTGVNQISGSVTETQVQYHQEVHQKTNINSEIENLPKPTSSQILTWLTQLIQGKKIADSQTAQNYQTSIPQLEIQPDWIDTPAKFLGYEKHPLEQTLEWLDWLLVRLEQIFINLVYFLRGLFSGK